MPCMLAAGGGIRLRTAIATSPPPMSTRSSPLQYYHASNYPLHGICRRLSSLLVASSSSSFSKSNARRERVSHDHQSPIFNSSDFPTLACQLYSSTPPSTPPCSATRSLGRTVDEDNKCSLVLIGLNMETAPAMMREKLLICPKKDYPFVIQHLLGLPSIKEVVVLSTPEIFQVYAVVQPTPLGVEEIITWMSDRSGLACTEIEQHIFVHRDGKAARHLFEASAVSGPKPTIPSLVLQSQMLGWSCGGLGVILWDLTNKALYLRHRRRSATESISSAALAVAQAEVPDTIPAELRDSMSQFTPHILVVGGNMTADLLIDQQLIAYNRRRRKIVVVCHDREIQDDRLKQWADVGIPCRPISELLSSASEANLIFIASPSHDTPLFSANVIDGLPPPPIEKCGSSRRIIIDMCHPPSIDSNAGVESARVFGIDDIFQELDRRASELRRQINGDVEGFESWMEGALEDGVYGEGTRSAAVPPIRGTP